MSGLGWAEGENWDVRFEYKDCGTDNYGAPIAPYVTSPTEAYWEPLAGRGGSGAANYRKKAEICISNKVIFLDPAPGLYDADWLRSHMKSDISTDWPNNMSTKVPDSDHADRTQTIQS